MRCPPCKLPKKDTKSMTHDSHTHQVSVNDSSHNLSPSDIKDITERRGIDMKWAIANCRRVSDRGAELYLGYPSKSPGILFVGNGTQSQFRPDEPWAGADGKRPKYRTPTSSEIGYDAFLPKHPTSARYWDVELLKQHCWKIDGIPFIILTEGVFKAIAGCSNGLPTISLLGVTMGLTSKKKDPDGVAYLVPALKKYAEAGFGFIIAFDADAKSNKSVRDAERYLMAEILQSGCKVFSATGAWEIEEGKGMDDFIKINGPEEFKSRIKKCVENFFSSSRPRTRKIKGMAEVGESGGGYIADTATLSGQDCYQSEASLPEQNYVQKAEAALYSEGHWVSIAGQLYRFTGSHYELQPETTEKRRIRDWLTTYTEKVKGVYRYTQAKPAAVNTVYDWMVLGMAVDINKVNPPGLNCVNGVVKINPDGSHSLVSHNHRDVYTYVGSKYDPDIDATDCDRLLECLEPQQREIFLRTAAASLCLSLARLKMSRVKGLLCHGEGSNGKDTLRTALVAVLERGVTGKSLKDFQVYDTGRKFPLAGLENSLCNWSSENADTVKLDKLQSLKQFITGDELTIEHKGRGEYPYKPEAIFLANCNLLPSISSDSEAIRSRYCILSFKKTYAVNADKKAGQLEADPRFKQDPNFIVERIAPALLNRCWNGYHCCWLRASITRQANLHSEKLRRRLSTCGSS
jgi:putative DNA primase/helicase